MEVVRTTTYRGRDNQKVVHEDVAVPLEYAVAKEFSIAHKRKSSWTSSLWKAGPWSVWMTSRLPNRPIWLSLTDAVSTAVVDLVGNNSNPSGEGIDDNEYILVTMGIFSQWSNMIQMKNFKWIIGRTSKSMSLDRYPQSISNLTVRTLPKKLIDHAVRDLFLRLKIVLETLFIDHAKATLA